MNLKKKTKEGKCRAMRCTGQDLGKGFCEKHIETASAEGLLMSQMKLFSDTGDPIHDAGMQAGIEAIEAEVVSEDAILPPFTQAVATYTESSYKQRLTEYLEYLPVFEVTTQEDMDCLNEWLSDIKQIEKGIETEEKKVTKPLNAGIAAARDLFRPLKNVAKEVKKLANDKIAEKLRQDKEAQVTALQQVEAAGGDTSADILSVAHGQGNVEVPSNTYLRTYWHVEILDPAAVPRDFCKPDESMLKAYATQTKGQLTVPGVRFYSTDTVTSR